MDLWETHSPVRPEELQDAQNWLDAWYRQLTQPATPTDPQVRALTIAAGMPLDEWYISHRPVRRQGTNYENGFGWHAPSKIAITLSSTDMKIRGGRFRFRLE